MGGKGSFLIVSLSFRFIQNGSYGAGGAKQQPGLRLVGGMMSA